MVKSWATCIRVGTTAGEMQGHCINRSERLGAATPVAVRKEFLCSSRTTGFLGVTRSQQWDGAGQEGPGEEVSWCCGVVTVHSMQDWQWCVADEAPTVSWVRGVGAGILSLYLSIDHPELFFYKSFRVLVIRHELHERNFGIFFPWEAVRKLVMWSAWGCSCAFVGTRTGWRSQSWAN